MKKMTLLHFISSGARIPICKPIGLFLLLLCSILTSKAQVDVTASGGAVSGTYTTLKTAFDSINAGYHTGIITIGLTANTTETSSAAINASGSGAANYSSITISPSGGASRTISGSLAAALIDLNGADNIIIDGLNSGGNALIIENSNTGATGVSTIRFINDASNNQLLNCTIRGASAAVSLGTVLFSTGTTTGNDNNRIQGCTLEGSGANFPANAILSIGTSTAGIENSNNFITLNNISNFFSASLITNGVLVGAGNTDWAVSRNLFYQTATRNYTTANTHQIISIISGNNHRVDSNTIGYSSSAGTGTYTMTSTVATRLVAIDLSVGTTVASSVQFNTITAFNLTTSSGAATGTGILCGISVRGGNANIGTIYGNTIGATTGTGAITTTCSSTQGSIVGINSATTGTIQIHNNNIGSFTALGSTASIAGGVFGVTVSAIATSISVRNNTIGNATADNMRAGTSGTTTGNSIGAGISAASNATSADFSQNTVRNITTYGTGTGGYIRGIATSITTGDIQIKIDSNTIYNLATNSSLATEGSAQLGALGILMATGLDGEVAGNTIYNISHLNTGAFGTDAAGISIGVGKGARVFGNTIYKIKNASTNTAVTTPGTASGIFIRSGTAGTSHRIYNNMIALGAGEVTNTSFIGIWANHGSTPDPIDSIYHNTITIEGNGATGAQPTFCVARTDFSTTARTATMVIYNNILTNNRSGGTGKHYSINNNYGATTPSATGWGTNASDYNILNAVNTNTVGSWGSVDQTFVNWKTISLSDQHSSTAAPVQYVDSSMNLHLNLGTTLNPIESNGYLFSHITSDIDGDARPGPVGSVNGGGFIPDIGADEFDGVGMDFSAPLINYTTLTKTCSSLDRTLTATIIDQTGVYTSGILAPRIYYKKGNLGSWSSQQGTLMSGTTTNGIWQFPILSADMGGLLYGDSVLYYVIAQDSGAIGVNIRSTPSGVTATDVNTVTTHPSTPNQYTIGFSFDLPSYTLNSSAASSSTNFNSLASLQFAINSGCLTVPTTIDIATGTGPYIGPLVIPEMAGMSSTNTLTLNGNNETIQHTPTTTDRHILKLDGADYVTIKNLNITGLAVDFDWGIHLTNGANNDSIVNCTINLSANTSTTSDNAAGIVASASTTDANLAGNNANNLVIHNSTIIGGYEGIVLNGSATNLSLKNVISNNTIRDFHTIGIDLTYNDSTVVELNDISRAIRTTTGTFEGIELGAGNRRLRINANRIHNTHDASVSQSTAAYGVYSLSNDAPIGAENWITNNLLYNFNSGTGTIYALYNSNSDGTFYYHNSVSLDNASSTAGVTRGFFQTAAASNIDFRNNVISITRNGTGVKYCLYFGTTASSITSNKNVLYINSPAGTNGIGFYSIGQATLADWKLVNSNAYDQSSIAINPNFAAPLSGNLTPSAFAMNDIGDSVGVLTDFAGNIRPGNTPDPGALEFSPPPTDAAISWISPVAPLGSGLNTIMVNITNASATSTITDLELEYTDGVTPVAEIFSGLSIPPFGSQPISFTTQYNFTTSTNIRVYVKSVNGIVDGDQLNDTTQQSLCLALAAGTYTIDALSPASPTNYTSFASAIAQLQCGVLGPVMFSVVPGSGPYVEQITLSQIPGASNANRVTFDGNFDTLQFTPNTSNRHIVKFDGADFFTIKNLTIQGLATDFDWGIFFTNNANNDSIVNCTIDLSLNTSTTIDNSACIVVSASTTDLNLAGTNGENLTVTGCTLIGGYQGAVINGNGVNTKNINLLNNTIRDFYAIGVEYTQMDSSMIAGNDISRANRVSVGTFEGIEIGTTCKRITVTKNKVHDSHNSATTQSGTSYGIFHSSCDAPVGSENIVSNNLIYNLNSGTGTIYGLYNVGSNGVFYYYNTVDLSFAGSTSGTTYGMYQTTDANNIEIKNNIISISRGGTGTKNCLRFNTATSSITTNYNLLYMNAAGTVGIGYFNAINSITMANWQAANGGSFDQQSVSNNPLYNTPTLFIPLPNSVAVAAGTPILGITTDFVDSIRSATTPTIGAYEKAIDIQAPIIIHPNISNSTLVATRVLNNFATISDGSGVDTTTNKPRLYYKRTSDNNTYLGNTSAENGWKWVEATNTVSPFSFTIDHTLLFGGSVLGGDSIQYFMVAQDAAASPNLALSDGTFTNQPDSVDLDAAAFPITGILPYYIVLPNTPGGVITVGASGNFLNLTLALEYLKLNNFTSDVWVELLNDYNGSSGETFPLTFDNISRMDTNITITIRPSSTVSTMLYTAGVPATGLPLVDLNGAYKIVFDGRPGGAGTMSDIKWTIRNKVTTAIFSPTVRFINDARKNVLEYLDIQGPSLFSTNGTITFSTTLGSTGNDSNIVRHCFIRDRSDSIGIPLNAIYSAGTAGITNDYNRIEYNEIFNFAGTGVSVAATGNGGNWTIDNNSFYYNNATAATTAQTGILFSAASNNNAITNNRVGGTAANAGGTAWVHSGNSAFIGISASFDSLSTSEINHNVVSNISKTNTSTGAFTGIIISRGNALVSQNLVGDTINPNSITYSGTSLVIGISNTNTLANTLVTISNNRVANITSTNAGTGAIVRGISYSSGSPYPPCYINHNKVFKLTTNSAVAGYAAGSIAAQGIYTFPGGYPSAPCEIGYNTIYDITGTNTSLTAAVNIAGITSTNFAGSIHHNTIYDIKNSSQDSGTVKPTANGLYVRFLDSATMVHNNMISLSSSPSDSVQINGIMVTGANGSLQLYYYNSVYIGNNPGLPVSSYAFHRGENSTTTQSYQPILMQNNLFINNVSSPGLHYAVGNEGSRPDSSWISSINDYNNFYSVNPANLTRWGNTTGDLSTWQGLSSGDINTVSKSVVFVRTSDAELHLFGSSIGDFDLAGIALINPTSDFDGDLRNPFRPYMGADEVASTPVPVKLTQLTANIHQKDVIVNWTTASEINSLKFIVEASADGHTFIPVGSVRAKGNSTSISNYQFTHFNAQSAFNGATVLYYRLVSVDIDQKTSVSKIVNVSFMTSALTKQSVEVAPNPFNSSFSLTINALKDDVANIEIINSMGISVYSQTHRIYEGSHKFDIVNIENLPNGVYFVHVILNGETLTYKVLKN